MTDAKRYKKDIKEKVSTRIFKSRLFWVIVVVIVVSPCLFFAAALSYQYIVLLPKAKTASTQLDAEFKMITPFSNAKIVSSTSNTKMNQTLISGKYLTDAEYIDIFNYYDAQLKQRGWQLKTARDLTDWGQDLGGKVIDYCKGDYATELVFAGGRANYGWSYAFSMSWGIHDCSSGNPK